MFRGHVTNKSRLFILNSNIASFDLQTVKINKWDGAAAKNAIDDAIREVNTVLADVPLYRYKWI